MLQKVAVMFHCCLLVVSATFKSCYVVLVVFKMRSHVCCRLMMFLARFR